MIILPQNFVIIFIQKCKVYHTFVDVYYGGDNGCFLEIWYRSLYHRQDQQVDYAYAYVYIVLCSQ